MQAPQPQSAAPTGGSAAGQYRFSFLLAWRERRFAAARCRTLLRLYRAALGTNPQASAQQLYRLVVATHLGGNAGAADAVLRHAEASYAIWPVSRNLSFRDVVHYLAVTEFVATHQGSHWVCEDTKGIVEALIPAEL